MGRFQLGMILWVMSYSFANAQCNIPNGDFEDWVTIDNGDAPSYELPVIGPRVLSIFFLEFLTEPDFSTNIPEQMQMAMPHFYRGVIPIKIMHLSDLHVKLRLKS